VDASTRTVHTGDGAALHVEVTGDPEAPVTLVLAHGWTLTSASWAAQVAALAGDDIRVIAYDQRGHGASTRGSAPLSIRLLGYDVATVLDSLAPTGPVVLAGHSMGGMSVMALAAIRPRLFGTRVRGVALVGTAAEFGSPRLGITSRPLVLLTNAAIRVAMATMAKAPALANLVRRHVSADRRSTLRDTRWLLFGPDAPERVVAACAAMVDATPTRVIGAFYAALRAHDEWAALATLARVPVRVVVGALDRLTPVSASRRIAEAIDGAALTVEPDTGHMLLMERPAVVTRVLRDLLDDARAALATGASAASDGASAIERHAAEHDAAEHDAAEHDAAEAVVEGVVEGVVERHGKLA
jgi:pimeloyl-ACP methyl ester carboxylesterase